MDRTALKLDRQIDRKLKLDGGQQRELTWGELELRLV